MYLVVCLLLMVGPATTDNICGPKLGVEIKRTAWEGLGIKKIQAIYDQEAEFQVKILNGAEKVSQVAGDLSACIGQRYEAVRANQAAILKSLDGTASLNNHNVERCCSLNTSSLTYIDHLQTKVDSSTMCMCGYSGLDNIHRTSISRDILQSMADNAKHDVIPGLLWQHYTTNTGFHYTFMAHKLCQKCDPRDRPYYTESISPTPMDIIIAIDVSDHGNLELKTKVAATIINSTNPRNRIAIVKFCSDAWRPFGDDDNNCVYSHLAFATAPNVKTLNGFLAKPERPCGSQVNHLKGITKAFTSFEKDSKRGKVLVFLTDSDPGFGVYSHEDILQRSREENLKMNNSVVMVTYGFGSELSSAKLLQDLASNTSYTDHNGNNIEGSYTNINCTTNLHYQLGSFYSILATAGTIHHPIITAPYIDIPGQDLVVSLCLPIVQGSKLHGVTCVDDRVQDMFLNVTYFSQGFKAYMFLIDTAGRTILHPLLPRPCTTHQHPVLVHISTLEKGQGMQDVIDSMTKGETGYTSLYVKRRFDYGERPAFRKVASHYHWTKVNNTDFSLCLVFTDEDGDITVTIKSKDRAKFYHSTMVGLPENTPRCEHKGLEVISGGSTVAFNGSAYKYIDYKSEIQGIRNYFVSNAEGQGQQFVEEMKAQVELTGRADLVWSSKPSSFYDSIIDWRFLVTKGLIRLYPGTTFNTFHPTLQGWYQNAISNPGKVAFTRIGKNDIRTIILSSVIFAGDSAGNHSNVDQPVAVVAGEFSCDYFFQMMQRAFPVCKQNDTVCFLVDDKGFILVHTFYIDSWRAPSHLVSLEPEIAMELQQKGDLTKSKCLDLLNYKTIESWRLSPEDWIVKGRGFELHRVAGTNIFAAIAFRSTDIRSEKCNCKNITQCNAACDCPCHETLNFKYCEDKPYDLDDNQPCAIEEEIFDPIIKRKATANQPACPTTACHELITEQECSGNLWCSWCSVNGGTAGCHGHRACRMMLPSPKANCDKETGITNLEFVKGIFVGIAIAVVVSVAVSCVYHHVVTSRKKERREDDYSEPQTPTDLVLPSPYTTLNGVGNPQPPDLPPRAHVSANHHPLQQNHVNTSALTNLDSVHSSLYSDESKFVAPSYLSIMPSFEHEELNQCTNVNECNRHKGEDESAQGDSRLMPNGVVIPDNTHDYQNEEAVVKEWHYTGPGTLTLSIPNSSMGMPMESDISMQGLDLHQEATEDDRSEFEEGEGNKRASRNKENGLKNKNDYVNRNADPSEWKYNGPSLSLDLPDIPPVQGPCQGDGGISDGNTGRNGRPYADSGANERSDEGVRWNGVPGVPPAAVEAGFRQPGSHDSGFPGEGSASSTTHPKSYVR